MTEHIISLANGRGVGPAVEGEALVSRHGFGVRYDLNPATGVIANPDHDLFGESIAGRVLVFPFPKGGVAAAWTLAALAADNLAPRGLVFGVTSPVFVQGAVLADISVIHKLTPDPLTHIRTGDWLSLHPAEGRVEVRRRQG